MKLTTVVKIEKKDELHEDGCNTCDGCVHSGYNYCIYELSKWEMDEEKLAKILVEYYLKEAHPWRNHGKGMAKSILSRSSEWILRKEK